MESATAQTDTGAGGGTRTHTTLPSRDFKSLASTSSATSAPLFLIGFSPRGNECFPGHRSRFPKGGKTCSLCVPHPIEGPDDVRLRLDVPGVVLAHALRLVAQQVGHLRVVGAAGAPPPRGIGDAQAVQGGGPRRRSGRLAPSRAGSGSRASAFPFRSARSVPGIAERHHGGQPECVLCRKRHASKTSSKTEASALNHARTDQ